MKPTGLAFLAESKTKVKKREKKEPIFKVRKHVN
jgi:hypothetical protein